MEQINKTSSEILLEAASLLEQEGKWIKGKLFQFDLGLSENIGCQMCAHGAISFCGNPTVKEKVLLNNYSLAYNASNYNLAGASDYLSEKYMPYDINLEQWIIKQYGEVGLAHYKAFKSGLTFSFNDNPNTTKQDVINKLREAAALNIV